MKMLRMFVAAAMALAMPALLSTGCSTTQPVASSMGDAGITSRVKSQLVDDPNVDSYPIDVDTELGVVYLHGKVGSQHEKRAAELIARNTEGVRDVVNDLAIQDQVPDDNRWDFWVTTRVKSRLALDPEIRAMNVDVDTDEGTVYLTGIVRSHEQRAAVEQLVSGVEGVQRVVNRIQLDEEAFEEAAP